MQLPTQRANRTFTDRYRPHPRRYRGVRGLGEDCKFVNDHLFLGKSREEIARIMSEGQGIPYAQALADPSIALYTDPEYRRRMCQGGSFDITPTEISTPIEEGGVYTITKAVGIITEADARRLASMVGAQAIPERNILGQNTSDWTLLFPNGARMNASEVANLYNQSPDPYFVNQEIQRRISTGAGTQTRFESQTANLIAAANQASQAIGPITTYAGYNPVTGATVRTPTTVAITQNPTNPALQATNALTAAQVTQSSNPQAPRATVTETPASPQTLNTMAGSGFDIRRFLGFGSDKDGAMVNSPSGLDSNGGPNWLLWMGLGVGAYLLLKK